MKTEKLLGDVLLLKKTFVNLDAVYQDFEEKAFKCLSDRQKSDQINRALLACIQKEPEPCFLLSSVLEFIETVDQKKLLRVHKQFHPRA